MAVIVPTWDSVKTLVQGMPNPVKALQPQGIDLSVKEIQIFEGPGLIPNDASGDAVDRPSMTTLVLVNSDDQYTLTSSEVYLVTFNETVEVPLDAMAYLRPRSSLLRCGAALHTAVWDAGYCGIGQSLLKVYNPFGLKIQRDARIGQLVFHRLETETGGYSGQYQREGL